MTVNVDAINRTIDNLKVSDNFDMHYPSTCIIGHAGRANNVFGPTGREISSLFGITPRQGEELVFFLPYNYCDVKKEHAVKVLEHLRDTGEVDWKVSGLPL